MNLNDPVTVCSRRFGRIPARITRIDDQAQSFVAEDLTGFFIHGNGEAMDWLCSPEDIGSFIELGHVATDFSVKP